MKSNYKLNLNKKDNSSKKNFYTNKSKEIHLKAKYKKINRFHGKINKIFIIFNFILFIPLSEENHLIKKNCLSEIILTIKGKGNQKIISSDSVGCHYVNSNNIPEHILINGILQNYSEKMVYNLTQDLNNITLQWDHPLVNCNSMFL